ncbi:MAG TPA: FtsX-like permease family protein [Candidatus Dormibacteraeota bacterium]
MSGLWPIAWRSLRNHPLRAALTAIAVALGIAAVLGVQLTLDGLNAQAQAAQQASAGSSSLDVRVNAGSALTQAQITKLGNLHGVAQAVPLYEKRVVAGPAGSGLQGLTVTLVGLQDGSAALRPVTVVAGRLPRNGDTKDVAIDQGLASALTAPAASLRVGDKLQLITSTGPDQFTIVGLTSGTSGGPAFTRSAVFADDAAMQGTFKLGLQTPMVALRLQPGASSAAVAGGVSSLLGKTVTTVDPRGSGSGPLGDLRPLLVLATLLSVFIGAGVTANSVALAMVERRRETGLLRAAGASSRQVFRLFATEAVVVAAAGIPIGVGLGLLLGALLVSHYAPTDLPAPPFAPGAGEIFAGILAGFGSAVLGALVPAALAGRTRVLDALRFQPAAERQRVPAGIAVAGPIALIAGAICFAASSSGVVALGVALFLLGAVLTLPYLIPRVARVIAAVLAPLLPTAPTAADGLRRSPNRTALTAAGLTVSVATAVAMSSLVAGALSASDSWVSGIFVGDTVITSPVTQRDAIATAISKSHTVQLATELRIFTESVGGTATAIAAIDPPLYDRRGGLDVLQPDRTSAFTALASGPSVLAPQSLATASGWDVGTQLPIGTDKGTVFFTIAGIVSHAFPAGDGGESLVMGSDVARTYFGNTASGFDDLIVVSNGSPDSVSSLAAQYGTQAVPVSSIEASARDALQHSVGVLLALAIVSVLIAMLALVNTLVVNARQRTRELALLRAVGLSRGQALRLALSEAGLLALVASLIGVATGCIIALPMLHASSSQGFVPLFNFPAAIVITLVVAVVLAAILAALAPARHAATASVMVALRHD